MYYILCQSTGGTNFYQEVMRGQIQRYTDMAGATVMVPNGSHVVDPSPPQPSWALADTAAPVVPRTYIIGGLAFRNLFLPAEQLAIYRAKATNIQIQVWLDDVASAGDNIDMTDPKMVNGLNSLEAAGLIGPGRAAVIANA